MGAKSRTKGNRGELEIAGIISDLTGYTIKRRVRQHDGDSDLEGIPGWSVEVKRYGTATRADIARWWDQCAEQAQATKTIPVLFYRLDRADWRAVWPLALSKDLKGLGGWSWGYEYTAEGTPEAWACVMRSA